MCRVIIPLFFAFSMSLFSVESWSDSQSGQSHPARVVSIWGALQNGDSKVFENRCESNEHPICVLGRFILGKSSAKVFLINSRFNQTVIATALSEDQAIAQNCYQNHEPNPMGTGFVFSILDLISGLSNLYPRESFDTLLSWYRASEGEYAEYAKEKLRIFLKSELGSQYKAELLRQYGDELQEIQE